MERSALSQIFHEIFCSFNHKLYFISLQAVENRTIYIGDFNVLLTADVYAKPLESKEQLVVLRRILANQMYQRYIVSPL